MRLPRYWLGIVLNCCAICASADDIVPRIERWELHTSLLTVRSVTSDGQHLWAATSGGLFVYDPQTGAITPVRKTEGVVGYDFTAIGADTGTGVLLAGTFDGMLELRMPGGPWEHISDIASEPGLPNKRITAIVVAGRLAYVGTAFGLVVLDIPSRTVAQTAMRFGTLPPQTPVYAVALWNDSLWVGTASGLAGAPVGAPFLNDPAIWRVLQRPELSSGVTALQPAGEALLVATAQQVLQYHGGELNLLQSYSQPIVGIAWDAGQLWVATQQELWQELPERRLYPLPTQPVTGLWNIWLGGNHVLIIAAEEQGLWYWSDGGWHSLRPNTPHTNLLLECAVDARGNLWCATDRNTGRGFACLCDGVWRAFTTATHPQLGNNEYHRVHVAPSGTDVWLASWGRGLLRATLTDTGIAFTSYNVATTPLRGIPADTTFLPIGEIATDPEGNLWAVCHWCVTGALVQLTPEGHLQPLLTALPTAQRQNLPLVIDAFGTKWFGSLVGDGLFYFREQSGSAVGSFGQLTAANSSLPYNVITALALDQEGMIWVGTPAGVGVVLNPSAVLSGSLPVVRNVSLLRDLPVYDIAVDVYNNKWLATDSGVWVVNPDATAVLLRLTAENSPLPSNQVRAVNIEPQTGRVFVGTRAGLAVLVSSARQPAATYSLQCYPQPFFPERDEVLTIDGLAEQSIVRVLTLEGLPVARFQTQSRVAYWNGRNERGEIVPAGVYIITALSAVTGETAQAKVVVVRQ
jgi:ligand-binding sensor domain-containing protein